jgi:hypothetical protein
VFSQAFDSQKYSAFVCLNNLSFAIESQKLFPVELMADLKKPLWFKNPASSTRSREISPLRRSKK